MTKHLPGELQADTQGLTPPETRLNRPSPSPEPPGAAIRVVLATMRVTFLHNVFDGFILFTLLVQPLLVAFLALWMLKGRGPEYGIYVVVGSGMSGLWSSLLFISGNSVNAERWFGTLETLTGVPSPLQHIVFGKNLSHVLQSLISMITTYIFASLVFGYPLTVEMPLPFAVSLLLTVFAFISFGLIIAPVFVLNPQIQQWQNGFEFPVYILSGFLFPVIMLPLWLRPLSFLLPTYWAAKALHASARGTETIGSIFLSWGILLGSSIIYLAISKGLFTAVINRAKKEGTLDSR